MKITHLTSVHPRDDIRIFIKECCTLAQAGYEVSLIVADGQGKERVRGVQIDDVGAPSGRLNRIALTGKRLLTATLVRRPDVVHFHDPELIGIGWQLKKAGIKVVYDVHEDVPQQILDKRWLPAMLRPVLSYAAKHIERYAAQHFDAIVTATPYLTERFALYNQKSTRLHTVCNYPIVQELVNETPWEKRHNEICYLGSLSHSRGISQLIDALPSIPARLNLAGRWSDAGLKTTLQQKAGWAQVNDLGQLDRQGVAAVLARSKIGVVTLLPTPNYVNALPIKLFEYMAAGLAVVVSDIPLWRSIVQQAQCGLLVDPYDPAAIAHAICTLLADENYAEHLGQQGRKAVIERYHWAGQAQALLDCYQQLAP